MDSPATETTATTTTATTQADRDQILAKHAEKPVSSFMQNKLIKEAARNWDLFYKRNTTNFFKDRHWTWNEFPELSMPPPPPPAEISQESSETIEQQQQQPKKILLEVGCGVGNFAYPLIQEMPHFFVYACDFSARAVGFVQSNPLYDTNRIKAFVCDITETPLSENVPPGSVDVVSAIFCLSAIPPHKLAHTISNIATCLKPGGVVLFRDYAVYDEAELRFKPGHMMSEHFYMRQDGTFSVYFSTEQTAQLFTEAGFDVLENTYVVRDVENRKKELKMERRFVQGRFQKKMT